MSGTPALLLCNARIPAGMRGSSPASILISDEGVILDIGPDIEAAPVPSIDLGGRLVTPGFIDMHQHLDKSFTLAEAPNPDGTLIGAIEAFRAYSKGLTRHGMIARAQATVDKCVAMGTCAIRTHANLDHEMQLRSVEAMCTLRDANRERIHLEVVAFATSSAARGDPEAARALLEEASVAGADCIGGTPNLAPDPKRYIDMLFDVAERHGRPIDLHIDETLDPQARWFDYLVESTRQRGMGGRSVGSHVSSLSAVSDDEARRSIDAAAAAGVAVCTLPAANLFLQGRDKRQLVPRGLTRVTDLLAAGVPVATASDNMQDAFVPVGSGDTLEMARWTILSAHLLEDAAGRAFAMITDTPAKIMGLQAVYG
ncbi:amidohydrolase family protein, partial [Rhizobiaceae sp. 2RAB30]